MRKALLYIFLFVSLHSFGQSPGGVSGALRAWYKANEGTANTVNNSSSGGWSDQSGNGYNCWVNGTPIYKDNTTDNINFNPTIYLDGSSYFNLNNPVIRSGGYQFGNPIRDYTIIGVGIRENGNYNVIFGDNANNGAGQALVFGYNNANTEATITHWTNDLDLTGLDGYTTPGLSPFILMGNFDQSNGRVLEEIRNNSFHRISDANTTPLDGYSGFHIGRTAAGGLGNYTGRISEVLVYQTALSGLDKQQIYTYLALKYGLTLPADGDGDATPNEIISGSVREGDYVASDGSTVIWDYATQGSSYYTNLAGIGRDDDSELDQKQSKSQDPNSLITFGLNSIENTNNANSATFSSDLSFLLWANNGGTNAFTSAGAPSGREVLGRQWRIQETGTVGTVRLQIPASTSSLAEKLPAAGTLDLLVDSDGDFTSGSSAYAMTLNGTNWEIDINLADGDYFTVAPGGADLSTTVTGNENGPVNVVFTVTLPSVNSTGSAFTFDIDDAFTGSATNGADYVPIPLSATISVPNGAQTGTYSITVINDADAEGIETIDVIISNPSGAQYFIGQSTATGTILDDDAGPGGIGGALNVWLRADFGTSTSTDNSTLTTWSDQSIQGNDGTSDGAPPLFKNNTADNINFNPTIDFDGTNDRLALDLTDIKSGNGNGNGKYTIMAVGVREDGNANYIIGSQNYTYTQKLHFGYSADANLTISNGPDVSIATNGYTNPAPTPYLIFGQYNGSGRILEETRDAVFRRATDNNSQAITGNQNNYIGDVEAGSAHYNGRISELIVYDNDLPELSKHQVYSYLALKYGIQLGNNNDNDATVNEVISGSVKEGDYVASDGSTIIWDYAGQGATYFNDVAGIGRDDGGSLNQKQSKSANTDALITMGLDTVVSLNSNHPNTFTSDNSFLLWGNNNGTVAFTTTGAPTNREILGRIWKVQKTGTPGTVKLRVPASTSSLSSKLPAASSLDILVDDDGDFTSGARIVSLQLTGTNWEGDVDFDSGDYFTFSPKGADLSVSTNGNENGPVDIVFTVTLPSTNSTGSAFTFDIDDAGTGTATPGSDYTAIPGAATISVPNGSTVGTYTVTVSDDALAEGNETVTATISNPSSAAFFAGISTATATIFDNDAGPGGVGNNLIVWLKANSGTSTSTDNTSLTNWSDQSSAGHDATDDGNPPLFRNNTADNLNYNPAVDFDGSNDRLVLDLSSLKNSNYTLLGLGMREDGNANYILGSTGGTTNNGLGFGYTSANTTATLSHWNNDLNLTGLNGFNTPGPSPFMLFGDYSGSGRTLEETRDATFNRATDNTTTDLGGTETNYVGYLDNTSEAYRGLINEVIAFNSTLSPLEKQQVYSYLALKYGLTLTDNADGDASLNEVISGSVREGDYVASDGSTIFWNYGTNGSTYFNDIAGIGRDDASQLIQKQSLSSGTDALVIMGLNSIAASNSANAGSFSADKSFLMWGNNNSTISFTTTGAPDNRQVLQRKWRVQETGTIGTVKVRVAANNSSAATKIPATAVLDILVDADGDFTSGATAYPMSLNGTNWEADINFTTGQYFTFSAKGVALSVSQQGSENGPLSIQYTVTLPNVNTTGTAISFDIDDAGTGTATSGSDYTAIPAAATISVADGSQTGTYSVSVQDDALPEANETLIATISNPSNAEYFVGTASATASILDNDVGPGSVGNNLVLWLKANSGTSTSTNNTSLSTWMDQSSGANNASSDGSPPTFRNNGTDNINYNPTVDFDGINDRLLLDQLNVSGGNYTLIGVGERQGTGFQILIGSEGVTDNSDLYFGYRSNNVATLSQQRYSGFFNLSGLADYDDPQVTPFLLFGDYDGSNRSLEQIRDAGFDQGSAAHTTDLSGSTDHFIGDHEIQGNYDGLISEVIAYDASLTDLDKLKVYSYLAIKYGITLPFDNDNDATANEIISGAVREGDYIASDGTTVVWNYATHTATYYNDLAGIGRDDESNLLQKQSKAESTDALLSIGLNSIAASNEANGGSFSVDRSFLIWGNNNGSLSFSSTGAPSGKQILARNWTVQESGTIGHVTIQVPASTHSATAKLPYATALYILTDTDNDFTTGATTTALSLNGNYWEGSVDLADGSFFTFMKEGATISTTTNGDENGPVDIVFTVDLPGINTTGSTITFDIADAGTGSATSGSDYTAIPGGAQVSIADGASSATYTVPVIYDGVAEVTEDINVVISNPSNASIFIEQGTANATIAEYTIPTNPAPGGIDNNLVFWLKADTGTSTSVNGGSVTSWTDVSNNTNNASSSGTAPTFASVLSNYQPAIDFTSTADYISIPNDNEINTSTSSAKSYSIVLKTGSDITTRQLIYEEGGGTHGLNIYIEGGDLHTNIWVSGNDNDASTAIESGTTYVITFVYDGGSSRWDTYVNGSLAMSDASVQTSLPSHTGAIGLAAINSTTRYNGTNVSSGDPFSGYIMEMAYYNSKAFTSAERKQIESYLALKYGISMSGEYTASNGSTVFWDNTANAGYTNGVKGIGRDANSTLDQRQSVGAASDSLIRIGLGGVEASNADNANAFSGDFNFLCWGNDNGNIIFSNVNAPAMRSVLQRKWRFQRTGSMGTIEIKIPDNGSGFNTSLPPEETNVYLLTDADGDFSSGATETPLSLNGNYWEATLSAPASGYFTIATDRITDANLIVTVNGNEDGPVHIEFTVLLPDTNQTGSAITFDFDDLGTGTATSGFDYTPIGANDQISIADGEITATYTITVVDDQLREATETLDVQISNSSDPGTTIGVGSGTASILDNDQSYPGGVSENLTLWFKADLGTSTTTDGASVTDWTDQTNSGRDAYAIASGPDYVEVLSNFNPGLDFSPGGFTMNDDAAINSGGPYAAKSYHMVIRTGSDINTRQLVYEQGGGGNGMNIYLEGGNLATNLWNSSTDYPVSIPVEASTVYVITSVYDGANNTIHLYVNGTAATPNSAAPNTLSGHSGDVGIGEIDNTTQYNPTTDVNSGDIFAGHIMELVYFNEDVLTATEKSQGESYLALKYGVSMAGDYVSSDGSTVLWDFSSTPAFNNDITGIGVDGLSELIQKQSTSSGSDGLISIGLGSIASSNQNNSNNFTADESFLIWGNNDGSLSAVTSNASITTESGITDQLQRIWKIVETNTIGSVQVAAPQTALESYFPYFSLGGNLYLRVADDAAFTTNVQEYSLSATTINSVASYACSVDFDGSSYFTIVHKDIIVWTGTEWRGGLSSVTDHAPSDEAADAGKSMFILASDTAHIDESAEVNAITIQSNASLAVSPSYCLHVNTSFSNSGNYILEADLTGFAQYKGPAVEATYQQYIDNDGWHLIGSPFSDATFNDFNFLDENGFINHPLEGLAQDSCIYCNLWWYDPSEDNGQNIGFDVSTAYGTWKSSVDSSESFIPTKGWNMYFDSASGFATAPWTLIVSGTLNNGNVTQTVNENNGGWNLLANPYSSVLDWNSIAGNLPATIDNAYHIWDNENSNYATYMPGSGTLNATRYIAPLQGFFVQTATVGSQNSGDVLHNLSLTNANRPDACKSDSSSFFKTTAAAERIVLQTRHTANGKIDETVLNFSSSASHSFRTHEDVHKLFNSRYDVSSVYTRFGEHSASIAGVNYPASRDSVIIGVKAKNNREISIQAREFPQGWTVYLEDRLTGIWHPADQVYTFNQDNRLKERFKLHYSSNEIEKRQLAEELFTIYINDGDLVMNIRQNVVEADWQLTTVTGAVVLSGKIKAGSEHNRKESVSHLRSGAYIFMLISGDEVKAQKIPIFK
ncbi:MAG: Calx-beta domain-containing protein [Owenweeksia sp.]